MRNQIGIPPLEPRDDGPTPPVRKSPAPAAAGSPTDANGAGRAPRPLRYTADGGPTLRRDRDDRHGAAARHPGMDPTVREAARHDDVPDVGTSVTHPMTERDSNASLYIGLGIGAIAMLIIVLILTAIF